MSFSAFSHTASNRLAREVDAIQARSMGENNRNIFACFARYGTWDGSNWNWTNTSTTQRAVESFGKRGLAAKTTRERTHRGHHYNQDVWTIREDLVVRLRELEAEVQAERKARDEAREEDARMAAEWAEARTHTVKTFREALAAAGITGAAAELVINRLPK